MHPHPARLPRLAAALAAPLLLGATAACGDTGGAATTPTVTVTAPAVTVTAGMQPATAKTSSSSPTSSAPPPVKAAGSQQEFDKAVFDYLQGRKGAYGVAATDLTSGKTLTHNPGQRCETASLIKLDVLLTLLLQRQDEGRELSESDRALTRSMIIYSDNGATTQLWGRVGQHEAVRAANQRFGMTETDPGSQYRWGLTTTTAPDQVRLLQNLTKDGPLDQGSRDYALDLLGKVSEGQDWGVSAANPEGEAQLKNGWLPRSDGWVVTSAGRVRTAADHDLLMAVVSCHGSSQQHSVESIEHIARMAAATFDKG